MSLQHKEMAEGRWQEFSLVEQMANIGSEVSRALNWKAKGKPDFMQRAADRALELMDLTLATKLTFARYKEVARIREAIVDYFYFSNEYGSSEESWRKYFYYFAYAARKDK